MSRQRTVTLYRVEDDDAIERYTLLVRFAAACQHARHLASTGQQTEVARIVFQVPSGKDFKTFLCRLHDREAAGAVTVIRRYIPTRIVHEDEDRFDRPVWAFRIETVSSEESDDA